MISTSAHASTLLAPTSASHLFTDGFDRPDGAPGSDWTVNVQGFGTLAIVSGRMQGSNSLLNGGSCIYNGSLNFGSNYYSEIDVLSDVDDTWVFLFGRYTNWSNFYMGRFAGSQAGTEQWQLYKRVAGTYTLLSSLTETEPSPVYRIRLEVNGSSQALKLWNGTSWITKCSASDAAIASGKPGFGMQGFGSGAVGLADNYAAGLMA